MFVNTVRKLASTFLEVTADVIALGALLLWILCEGTGSGETTDSS